MMIMLTNNEVNTIMETLGKISDETEISIDSLEANLDGIFCSVRTEDGGLFVDFDADLFAAAFELYGDLIAKMMTACEELALRFEGIVKIAQTKAAAEKKAAEDAAEIESLKAELAKAKANAEA